MSVFNIFGNPELKRKKSHLKNLLAVGLADGTLDEIELAYLSELAKKNDISPEEVNQIIQDSGSIKFKAPHSFEEKVKQLHDLVTMMVINGEVHEKEVKICKSLSLKMDILPKMVDDLVLMIFSRTKEGTTQKIILEEAVTIYKN